MASDVPVRLSAALAMRARTAAASHERSLAEQVEHWARLGQVVEDVISAATVQRLKARGCDFELASRLAMASTAQGRAKAAQLIRERNPVRHGIDDDGAFIRVGPSRKRTRRTKPR